MVRVLSLALALVAVGAVAGSFISCGGDTAAPVGVASSATGGPGAGGGGGGEAPCQSADDCPRPNACVLATCESGVCGLDPLPANTPLGTQAADDCQSDVCDGSGAVTTVVDDSDAPNDNNPCTTDGCSNGVPTFDPLVPGTDCPTGVCDDMGSCVECNVANDCPGMDDECQERTCDANTCGVAFTAAMTPVAVQVAGDCNVVVCDGQGLTMTAVDDDDLPVDFNDCTADVCENGVETNPFLPQGDACGASLLCDGNGNCVGCVTPTDCSGTDDECKVRTCVNTVCGFDFTPMNTPVSQQNPGDCQLQVCDGAGTQQPIADDIDVPVDGNVCTSDACSNGVPSNPPVPAGTMCGQNGGTVCSVNGQCVECNLPADCPPAGQLCKVATCQSSDCGIGNAPMGTVCGAASCAGGVQQSADVCDNGGTCVDGGSQPCSPYVCGPTACNGICVNDNGCASGFACDTALQVCTDGPKCTDYCNTIQPACVGANQQYTTIDHCLDACATLPRGTAADGGGNTVGCRINHANLAVSAPAAHCTHAGPGGDGVCGTNCQGFCTIAQATCTGSNQQFASEAVCQTECAGFPAAPPYNTSQAFGDSLACRLYHLTEATQAPGAHCIHIVEASATCHP